MTSSTLKERVQATLKSEDTEGTFELYVTRTPGYLWALLFKKLHIHPIAVTLLSIVIGALAGYFFWWDDLYMNLIGMFLLIWANWYDCADGQLARMTGQKTLIGRITSISMATTREDRNGKPQNSKSSMPSSSNAIRTGCHRR